MAMLVLTIPGLLFLCLGLYLMITEATFFSVKAYKGFQILGGILILICVGIVAFVKIKFPYYSDKIASHIRKSRKSK